MTTSASFFFDADDGNATPARMATVMSSLPFPDSFLTFIGGIVTSDVTAAGTPLTSRTFGLRFGPNVAATTAAVLEAGSPSGSPVTSITVTNGGSGYTSPPIVSTTGGGTPSSRGSFRSKLSVGTVAVVDGAGGVTSAWRASFFGRMSPPVAVGGVFTRPSCVQSLTLIDGGKGYTFAPTVEIVGGLGPGGVAATAVPIVDFTAGGVLTGVTLTSPGSGYVKAPQVIVRDPSVSASVARPAKIVCAMGEGTPPTVLLTIVAGVVTAVTVTDPGDGYIGPATMRLVPPVGAFQGTFTVEMRLGRIDVLNGGKGYTSVPTVVLTNVFDSMFPAGKTNPFRELLTSALAATVSSGVRAGTVIVV